MNKLKSIPQLLDASGMDTIERLISRSKQLIRLEGYILSLLGAEFRPHCRLLNISDENLILAVDSTVWATRLRYQLPTLQKMLQSEKRLEKIRDITIRVTPSTHDAAKPPKKRAQMSRDAASCVNSCAQGISDKHLSQALERLARHGKAKG